MSASQIVAFDSNVTYATSSNAFALAVGDVNGDGRPDLVVQYKYSNNLNILLGNGDGTFATGYGVGSGSSLGSGYAGPNSVAIRDVNGDGHPDLVGLNNDTSTAQVFLGNGDGTFANEVAYSTGMARRR